MEELIKLISSALASGGGAWIAINWKISRMSEDINKNARGIRELRSLFEAFKERVKREKSEKAAE